LTREQLEASLRYFLEGLHDAPLVHDAQCPSLGACEVTYFDPAFPSRPYTVRYRIVGEQLAGCWMAHGTAVAGTLPYPDVLATDPDDIAACASWASA
jgi:hypothetical protein